MYTHIYIYTHTYPNKYRHVQKLRFLQTPRVQDLALSLAHKAAQAEAEEAAKVKATKSAEQQAVARQWHHAEMVVIPYGSIGVKTR